ncbi:ribosome recycling factor [Nakamurella endophytica]|uniref:Ribosome-recycling factor n=1 Tax=Nakamurella endophytica TaxID=1748367 RepID=A0A917SPQ7_9ACTN|nr:ribosome recycling factor [Nakamurella endophytica]GGL90530.1 ribosome-recycling factor [Nakamurella endophytica]
MSEQIDEALLDAEERMEKAVSVAKDDLATLRTGRANPNTFSRVVIDYYGAPTPLPQMASINVPEARMAVIKPYDASQLRNIEKAIRDSDLGVNPGTDGTVIRVVFPQLTEERRRELGRTARAKGEDAKVSVRNIRRRAKEALDKLVKDGESGEDEVARAEKELQAVTDRYTAAVDELVRNKEAELLEV